MTVERTSPSSGKYTNTFQFHFFKRVVPYPAVNAENRNVAAFVDLKSDVRQIDQIPELATDTAMRDLIAALNAPNSGLLTIGCNTHATPARAGFVHHGYVEFAINDSEKFAHAASYFELFSAFERTLHAADTSEYCTFRWVMLPLLFADKGLRGFGCSIGITVHTLRESRTQDLWHEALRTLSTLHCAVDEARKIY